jgi:XTP/dITP diphosphohydrolase
LTPRLVIATNNRGKLREFRRLLGRCGFELVIPSDLGWTLDVDETGASFAENATLKATAAARLTGLPALADDSGLEVDALDGRPGLFSARYAGRDRTATGITEAEQREMLLEEMSGVPEDRRTARFVCAIAVATPDGDLEVVEAAWEGRIAHGSRGEHGFGYDPIFLPVEHPERTSAELDQDEKNRISHRGKAAALVRPILKEMARDG